MKRIGLAIILLSLATAVPAWQTPDYSKASMLYQDVVAGRRAMQSLTPQERQSVLLISRAMRSSCGGNSHKCKAVCEAANQLKDASEDLATCAGRHDYNDDCGSQFNSVRDAHDELESAVSDADGDCE